MTITKDIRYIGVNDHAIDLFESQYSVPNGMAYNSYVILDDRIAVMDSVDESFAPEWLDKLREVLEGRRPDYLVVQHMEPDHSANILTFKKQYPEAVIVASAQAFRMMKHFFKTDFAHSRLVVGDGDILCLGRHTLRFLTAPMVHWPEVIVTYDTCDKVLFSADAFGKFGALDVEEDWADEARRYYVGISGKYGASVQNLLHKIDRLTLEKICPLHGPVLTGDLSEYLERYHIWSTYGVEREGVVICYTSVYGNTRAAVELLAQNLRKQGCPEVVVYDLSRCDWSRAVEQAFCYGTLVLATTTYNGDIFPAMKTFLQHLIDREFCNRTVALMENGSWGPQGVRLMKAMLAECKNITFAETPVNILSALQEESRAQIQQLSEELSRRYSGQGN